MIMESIWRIWVLVRKDLYWAAGNFKLLGIMVMPVIFVIIFSRLDSESILAFNLSFINSFIGIFSTSYLIIEEKNKGTLLSLLTTPVRSFELLFSKFLFNLLLCLSVSLFAMAYNGRWNLLSSPLVLLNLSLFAGFTCFIGCVVGMFFKNEQEMSIFAPILMFFFVLGDVTDKMTSGSRVFGFFPDFHLARLVRDPQMSWSEALAHTGFNFGFFFFGLLMAALYTQFYFSNHRETRVSKTLFINAAAILLIFAGSGFLYAKDPQRQILGPDRIQQKFISAKWMGSFEFDPTQFKMMTIEQEEKRSMYRLRPQEKSGFEMSLQVWTPPKSQRTTTARALALKAKTSSVFTGPILWKTFTMQRHLFVSPEQQRLLTEGFCGDQLLTLSLDIDLRRTQKLHEAFTIYQSFLNLVSATCQESI